MKTCVKPLNVQGVYGGHHHPTESKIFFSYKKEEALNLCNLNLWWPSAAIQLSVNPSIFQQVDISNKFNKAMIMSFFNQVDRARDLRR